MIQLILDGGVWMIPINIVGLAILILGLERIYSLYIKKDHSPANLTKRLLSLKFLALLVALTGILATLTGFHHAFNMDPSTMKEMGEDMFMITSARYAVTTSIWGFTLAIFALTFRFIAEAKVSRIREMGAR